MSVILHTYGLEAGDFAESPVGARGHITEVRLQEGELIATVAEIGGDLTERVDWPLASLTPVAPKEVGACDWPRCQAPADFARFCPEHGEMVACMADEIRDGREAG